MDKERPENWHGMNMSWCNDCQENHYESVGCPIKQRRDKYEYTVTSNNELKFGWDKNIIINLNKFGERGWELCGIHGDLLYFKRKINER